MESSDQLPIRRYQAILSANRWLILAVMGITLIATAYQTSRQQATYTSSGQIWLQPPILTLRTGDTATLNIATELQMAVSPQVATIAARNLGQPRLEDELLQGWEVDNPADTEILEFSYVGSAGEMAQERATALSEAYLELRRRQAEDALTGLTSSLQERLSETRDDLQRENAALLKATAEGDQARINLIQPRIDSLVGQLGILQQQLASLVSPESLRVGEIVEPAGPAEASMASPGLNGVLGLLVGALLGAGIAFLRDRLDERVQDPGDLEYYSGARMLASLPRVKAWRRSKDPFLVSHVQPESPAAEAFNALRAGVLHAASRNGFKTILTTSAARGEGKSSTTANLATTLAKAGKRTVLIDADLRRSRVHQYFRVPNGPGLVNVLRAELEVHEALVRPHGFPPGLRLLTAGPSVTGHAAELLGSEAMRELILILKDSFDFVLIDSTPLLGIADTLAVAPFVDGALLVVDGRRTKAEELRAARERLDQLETPVVGSVLNRHDAHTSRRHYYAYAHPEEADAPSSPAPPDLPARPERQPQPIKRSEAG